MSEYPSLRVDIQSREGSQSPFQVKDILSGAIQGFFHVCQKMRPASTNQPSNAVSSLKSFLLSFQSMKR